MSRELVTCDVQYIVTISHTDYEGFVVNDTKEVGRFETLKEAEQLLSETGLVKQDSGVWYGINTFGRVTRSLTEV
jgi:trehalose utilization protein